jgi:sulfoxide reductase heme-binding subunit YedZ
MKIGRYTPLQIFIHAYGWAPLTLLIVDFFTDNLTANPIQAAQQRMGRAAILFLILSLACTPLNTLFGWREALKRRRALGLYCFMYAAIHMFVFVGVDLGLNLNLFIEETVQKRYILIGVTAFLLLLPLAVTSFNAAMKAMGLAWRNLHRLVYVIGPLVVLHYAWAKKGDIFHLSGDILRPLIYAGIVTLLLTLRVPQIRKAASALRMRITAGMTIGRK